MVVRGHDGRATREIARLIKGLTPTVAVARKRLPEKT